MPATNDFSSPGVVDVSVQDPAQIDSKLDSAVHVVKPAAIRHRTGILITRTSPGQYVVRAHPAVPFGLIRQRYA